MNICNECDDNSRPDISLLATNVYFMVVPEEKSGKSFEFIMCKAQMSAQKFMGIYPVLVEICQFGQKWFTNQLADIVIQQQIQQINCISIYFCTIKSLMSS